LNIESRAEFRFFEKAFIPGISKILNPKSKIVTPTSKPGGWEAGSREQGAWRRMGRAEPRVMGFALPITF
jgi:hypothetical protein